jgi:hypothetical protein
VGGSRWWWALVDWEGGCLSVGCRGCLAGADGRKNCERKSQAKTGRPNRPYPQGPWRSGDSPVLSFVRPPLVAQFETVQTNAINGGVKERGADKRRERVLGDSLCTTDRTTQLEAAKRARPWRGLVEFQRVAGRGEGGEWGSVLGGPPSGRRFGMDRRTTALCCQFAAPRPPFGA